MTDTGSCYKVFDFRNARHGFGYPATTGAGLMAVSDPNRQSAFDLSNLVKLRS
jgi:hypothetical protein